MKKADKAKEFRADRFMTGGGHDVQYFPAEEAARAFLEENREGARSAFVLRRVFYSEQTKGLYSPVLRVF